MSTGSTTAGSGDFGLVALVLSFCPTFGIVYDPRDLGSALGGSLSLPPFFLSEALFVLVMLTEEVESQKSLCQVL